MTQRLRLFAGLVLFTYVATHLLNHSLGMISLDAAEAGRAWFTAFWRSAPATALLYGSLTTHFSLVLWAIFRRRHLRIPRWEILRLLLGLCIPVLLLNHAFGTRVTHEVAGVTDNYHRQVLFFWVLSPLAGLQQVVLLLVAWAHGCLGIHYWLRVKRWHARMVPAFRLLGLLVPLCALVGFVNMGLEVQALAADPAWVAQTFVAPSPEEAAKVDLLKTLTIGLVVSAIVFVFVARRVRDVWQRRRGVIRLTYPGGRRVAVVPGTTVLEASRSAGIPHASLCGGRGRCSTCRSRIGAGLQALPAPSADEARVLRRIGAPPNVRLACQLRPTADLEVFPLLPPVAGQSADLARLDYALGTEQEIAVLFADLRSFTRFAESRLPYDVVFVLNQYFAAMGEAVAGAGGRLDKFIGDGVMALFGLTSGPTAGCRQALAGALAMTQALDQLNRTLHHELAEPLRMGIGIHVGPVIVGEMGYGPARSLTAIGDTVNIASRLESLTKEYGSQLIVSEAVATRAGVDLTAFPLHEIQVRSRADALAIRVVVSALAIEAALEAGTAANAAR